MDMKWCRVESTYIEGIAVVFESRNYLVILTSLVTTLFYLVFNFWAGFNCSSYFILISKKLMAGGKLKDIVDIEYVEPHFDGPGFAC